MSDVVRNVTINIRTNVQPFTVKPPDITPVVNRLKQLEDQANQVNVRISQTQAKLVQTQSKAMSGGAGTVNTISAAEGLKRAGEGAFIAARGMALLNAENEEDLQKLVKRIAYYQGMFDIFKGGTDIVSGLAQAHKALAVAQAASAASAGQAAGTVNTLSTAMLAARGSAVAMMASLGPAGWAAIAVTAIVAAGAAMVAYANSVETAQEKLRKQADALEVVRRGEERLIALRNRMDRAGRRTDLDTESRNVALTNPHNVRSMQDERDLLERDARRARARMTNPLIGSKDPFGKDVFFGQSAGLNGRGDDRFPEFMDERKFNWLQERVKMTRGSVRDFAKTIGGGYGAAIDSSTDPAERQKALNLVGNREVQKIDALSEAANVQQQAAKGSLEFAREHLEMLDKQAGRMRAIVDQEKERQKAISDSLKAEQLRNMSEVEKIGRLNPYQRQRLNEISEKVESAGGKADTLQKHERDFLDEIGLGGGILSRYYINEGEAAGAGKIRKRLGADNVTPQEAVGSGLVEGENRIESLQTQRSRSQAGVERADAALAQLAQRSREGKAEEMRLMQELFDRTDIVELMKQLAERQKRQIEQALGDLDKFGPDIAKVNAESRRAAMNRRL